MITIHDCDDITIKDITIQNGGAHGINVYKSDNITLENVNLLNNDKAGLVVNGSTVLALNLYTSGNIWGGANVDQGTGITEVTNLTVDANTVFDQAPPSVQVWLDDPDNPDITFTALGVTYNETSPGVFEKGAPIIIPNPSTGDDRSLWWVFAAVALLLIASAFIYVKIYSSVFKKENCIVSN